MIDRNEAEPETPANPHDEYRERRRGWLDLERLERQRVAIEALGDRRLTIRELTEAMEKQLPGALLYASDVGALIRGMAQKGDVARELENGVHAHGLARGYFRFPYPASVGSADLLP
jgi:hypothetical protein